MTLPPRAVKTTHPDRDPRATDPPGTARVHGDEPLLAARVHRPSDLMRFLAGLLGVIAVLALAGIAHNTTTGITSDITSGATKVHGLSTTLGDLLSGAAVLLVPLAFTVERLARRDGMRLADGVLAAVLAHSLTLGLDWWVVEGAGEGIRNALTRGPQPGGGLTDPVHGYLVPVIAYMTAAAPAGRPRWRVALWSVVVLNGGTELISGYSAPMSLALTVLLGWTVAHGTRYAIGSPNARTTGRTLLVELRKAGFRPATAHRAPDGPGGTHRYYVAQRHGPPLDVHVIDRELQASGFFYRLWRRIRLRSAAVRRSPRSPRQALEHESLISYAAASAGARAPRLVATAELGPDAAILVYEHVTGRTLDELPDAEITDELLSGLWESVRALQDRQIAHRRLTGESLLAVAQGPARLTNLSHGDIAAGDFALRMDIAQLLTTFALRAGPERAVATAADVLGPARVAAALPLLQPIGLSRSTRADLRRYNSDHKADPPADDEDNAERDLLSRIRRLILDMVPETPAAPVRLERFKPKTLFTAVGGAIAVYSLLTAFPATQIDFAHMNGAWVLAAFAAAALSHLAAAMCLIGFVPRKLPFGTTLLAQIAGSFVKLVTPAAIGGVALNTRFLQKSGVRPVQAVASVGVSQLAGLACHLVLLFTFGYIGGTEQGKDLAPSRTVIAGLLTAAVLVLTVTAVPPLRRFVAARLRPLLSGVVPHLLDLLQRPYRLAVGFGGYLLLTAAFVACLDASLRAFGGSASIAVVAVVFLTANAVGSAAPTPGGIGAIEGALIGTFVGLAHVPIEIATPAVLLYRILIFWLPVLPGWACFGYLQRKGAL
ncbi:lysylphosphatidylglycerol synthase transmembrane domain-containing protein [Streptomyces sp. NPDC046261]|uniref:lysylphosphatidylglycerol synthase transmembrane domain-containing protein n=1 Tax=Streptomyces sp. NPDC046261 TaxID=3157200 RepID=UPI00340572B8